MNKGTLLGWLKAREAQEEVLKEFCTEYEYTIHCRTFMMNNNLYTYQTIDIALPSFVGNRTIFHCGKSKEQKQGTEEVNETLVHDVLVGQHFPHVRRAKNYTDN